MYSQEKYFVIDYMKGFDAGELCEASGLCFKGIWKDRLPKKMNGGTSGAAGAGAGAGAGPMGAMGGNLLFSLSLSLSLYSNHLFLSLSLL